MLNYVYFWLIFGRAVQTGVIDLALSQLDQIWCLNRVISV